MTCKEAPDRLEVSPTNTRCLPYELERDIFELTAKAFPGTAVKLALVSSYVHEWMETFIYRIVVLDASFTTAQLFLRTFRSRPRSFFAKHVKHLYLTNILSIYDARELISACQSAQTVACWVAARPNVAGFHFALPTRTLRRLSIKLETLWGYTNRPDRDRFPPEDYPQLTHLEIVNPPGHNKIITLDWEGICKLPSLTHLALGDLWAFDHMYLFPLMEEILRRCPRLKVLVTMSHDPDFISALQAEEVYSDPRLVLLPDFRCANSRQKYCATLREGGPDIWENAEEMRDRQAGEKEPCLPTQPNPAN